MTFFIIANCTLFQNESLIIVLYLNGVFKVILLCKCKSLIFIDTFALVKMNTQSTYPSYLKQRPVANGVTLLSSVRRNRRPNRV